MTPFICLLIPFGLCSVVASGHWLSIVQRVGQMRLEESLLAARRALRLDASANTATLLRQQTAGISQEIPSTWPPAPNANLSDREALKRLMGALRSDPSHPENWHRRLVDAELAKPQAADIYFRLRRALWSWEEFASLQRGPMALLHVIIELAREEAFPWYLPVPAEHVRRLARMSTRHYIRSIQTLDVLAIKRPARIVHLANTEGVARFPGEVDMSTPIEPIAQWVVRYRRGIPHNKKRAAWWVNYDLLCQTGRVQRCFVFNPRTLNRTYRDRNRGMGKPESWFLTKSDDGLAALEEAFSRDGPLPPAGLRAPLWRV